MSYNVKMEFEHLKTLVDEGLSVREISKRVNKSYTTVRYWLAKHELKTKIAVEGRLSWGEKELRELAPTCQTYSDLIRGLGYETISAGHYDTVKSEIQKWNIDVSHFVGKSHGRKVKGVVPLAKVMVENSTYSRSTLKRKVLKAGILKNECSICGLTTWRDKKLTMIIDHINGINNDHRLENLRMLCPNCNSQQETHCGKNVKRKK